MGAPVLGSVCVSKTIIPEAQEHLLAYPPCRDTPSIGGFGFRWGYLGLIGQQEFGNQ